MWRRYRRGASFRVPATDKLHMTFDSVRHLPPLSYRYKIDLAGADMLLSVHKRIRHRAERAASAQCVVKRLTSDGRFVDARLGIARFTLLGTRTERTERKMG
ncbi:hypothetical protein EVAR_20477_1 [Eumeta japonica]|uniref:Uncharacterized protein n=1 Tax=Eumeta variegata TaxID=151549 RepID=A0A4C1TYP7_EUMVA|nr:hypothetical protein EVAR_20477_1 [Eumeta japonica]